MIETYLRALPHGITLGCRAAGEPGRPVLMFLHGFPEGAFVWDELLRTFADPAHGGYRCVAPNLRGFGPSSAPPEPSAYRAKHLVQDIAALIALETAPAGRAASDADPSAPAATQHPPLAALVAHDWGGAVAWNLANQRPELMESLVIINSPHPGALLRELQANPAQQAASAYMNFLIRPDAEALLAADDFRRLWRFFTDMGAADAPGASSASGAPDGAGWLTPQVRDQYRDIWRAGLTGGCNYYRATPLRPSRDGDPAAAAVTLPERMLRIELPTLVLWAEDDSALPPSLTDGLADWIPQLQLERIARATHWVIHEQPKRIARSIAAFLLPK